MDDHAAVLWFRRDLRVHDLPALAAAARDADRLAPLFVLDDRLLAGRWPSSNRSWFLLESLRDLSHALEARGSRLHLRWGIPEVVVPEFARAVGASRVHVTRDYAPYGRARDRRVHEALIAHAGAGARAEDAGLRRHPGSLVHEPEAISTGDGSPYAVYSPFRRRWDGLPIRVPLGAPSSLPPPPDGLHHGELPGATAMNAEPTADRPLLPAPGESAARARLERWLAAGIEAYHETRDLPGVEGGTSRLSQDLHLGLLSAAEVASRAAGPGEGRRRFLAELAWRDFYAHLLYHEPRLRHESFRLEFDRVGSPGSPLLDAWREGRTGYPFVDAALRQLHRSGWIHNRARMIAASFLVKHLLVDWRLGEAHFMAHLLDGDMASNNGGWQWAASVGTDPQPYFRIFNPVLQGQRFDADGHYVRRWVPELARVPDAYLHAPWRMQADLQAAIGCRISVDYPAPVVDHDEARVRALEHFRAARRRR